jgi:hypothetical protein
MPEQAQPWIASPSLAMTEKLSRPDAGTGKDFFSIFVDRKFTTSTQGRFTNAFEAALRPAAIACLCRAGHAN